MIPTVAPVQQFLLGLRAHVTVPRVVTAVAGVVTLVVVSALLLTSGATTEVWVVARSVPVGAPVTADDLTRQAVPADHPFGDHLVAGPPPVGVAAIALEPGRPLLVGDVAPGPAEPPRTVAVRVDADVVTALGLVAGDRVDLVAVEPHGDEPPTVVAGGVRVAAVGEPDGPVRSELPVVVEVDDREALAIAEATETAVVVVVRATGAVTERSTAPAGAEEVSS